MDQHTYPAEPVFARQLSELDNPWAWDSVPVLTELRTEARRRGLCTEVQRREWLEPLLDGEIRSSFAMTEPSVASSDASNIATRTERDGDEYVINGRKWWITATTTMTTAVTPS